MTNLEETPRRSRIDTVSITFQRKGKCNGCGRQALRTRTIKGSDYDAVMAEGNAWSGPLFHVKCER